MPVATIMFDEDSVPLTAVAELPKVKFVAPRVSLPAVNVSVPLIVGLPVKVKEPELFKLRFCSVAAEIVAAAPVIVMPPVPDSVPVPAMFPLHVTTFPPSASVPVRVRVVPTCRALPKVLVPALAVKTAKLFEVPGTVSSK